MGGGPLGVDEPAPKGLRGLVVCLNRIKTDLVEEGKNASLLRIASVIMDCLQEL